MNGLIGMRVKYTNPPEDDIKYANKIGTVLSCALNNNYDVFFGLVLFKDGSLRSICLDDYLKVISDDGDQP